MVSRWAGCSAATTTERVITREFAGRLFGPDLPGTGMAVTGGWDFGKLRLSHDEGKIEADSTALTLDAAGFNQDQTRISWQDGAGSYAFFLDTAHREAFISGAPAALTAQFGTAERQRRRTERHFRLGWTVLGLTLALPILLVMIFYLKADALADWVAERIPAEFEAQIGDLTLAQARTQSKLQDSGATVEIIRQIGEKLTPGSRHRYRWFVASDPSVNAYAAPGGVVVVNTGLIRAAASAEELAGVLAHEVSHVELRHSLKGAIKNLGLRTLLSLALGDFSGTLAGEAAANLTEMKFSRDAEAQADQAGLQRLVQAGIDPQGMPRFFAKLAASEGAAAKLPALLSTHPQSTERSTRLAAEIAALPKRVYEPLAVDWLRVMSTQK